MKHLVAILAHKNGAHLELLIGECEKRGYNVLLHLDAKCRHKLLANHPNLKKYVIADANSVTRAHFSIVEATVSLLKASRSFDYDYFHLISGEDYPTKSELLFNDFFTRNSEKNFINHIAFPVNKYEQKRSSLFEKYTVFRDRVPLSNYKHAFFKNGIGLVDTYHFKPGSMAAKISSILTPTYQLRKLYQRIFKRKLPKVKYYGGSAWFSITKQMAEYFVEQTEENSSFYKYFNNALFPDEVYFHTLALNSQLKDTVINSDLRYINWDKPINQGPSLLTKEHISEIKNSNGFFARKCDIASNIQLKNAIESQLY